MGSPQQHPDLDSRELIERFADLFYARVLAEDEHFAGAVRIDRQ